MQPSKKSDLKTVSHEWGGESEGAAGKHSGFQNNPGFEMLEMLGSGPFLKLGVGVGGRKRPIWSYQDKEEERAGQRWFSQWEGGPGKGYQVRNSSWPRTKKGGPCLLNTGQRRGLQWLLPLTGEV